MLLRTIAIVGVLATAPGSAQGQSPIDRTFRGWTPMSISVENRYGPVRVEGWTRQEVRLQGTIASGDSLVVVEADRRLEIRVVGGRGRTGETSLEMYVPAGNSLDAETLTGLLGVHGAGGVVRLRSGGGAIHVDGDVRTVTAETLSGAVIVRAPARAVVVGTGSGAIEVSGLDGYLEVTTVGGRVDVRESTLAQGAVTTVDGAVRFEGRVAPEAVVRIDTYVGDVELVLASDVDASFRMSTFGGAIVNELGPTGRGSRQAPAREMEFTMGRGSAQIVVDTFGGTVSLSSAGGSHLP